MSSWEDIDPELLVKAYDDPMMFIEAILPHLPLTLSPNQIKILHTFYDPKKKYTELLLCCGRKCVAKGTLIFDKNGKVDYIENVGFPTGIKDVYKLRTITGKEILTSKDHKFLTPKKWKSLEELRKSEKIAVTDKIEMFGNKTIDPYRLKLLAYLIQDGYWTKLQSVKFTNVNMKLLTEVKICLQRTFCIHPKWYKKGNGYDLLATTSNHAPNSNPLRNWLNTLEFIEDIPKFVFELTKEQLALFINRTFACCGCVSTRKRTRNHVRTNEIQSEICLADKNNNKLKIFQMFLFKFGINSWLEKRKRENCNVLRIAESRSLERFIKEIGLIYGKEEQCKNIVIHKSQHTVGWEAIKSIEYIGKMETYDQTIEPEGYYIANGIIVHNSGKTLLVSIIALYEVYRLLLTENLHSKYHLIPNSPIYIMVTATSREQALDVTFQYIRSLAQGSWYLNDYIVRVTSEEIEFTKNIIIRCQACSSSSGRGYPTWANIYDEHAHMKLRSGNAGGDVIYDALQPNLKLFKGDGKTVTISSPSGMEGIFWELFNTGDPINVIQKTEHQGEQPWRAVFQHPTWEMNPELGRNHPEIDKEFQSDYKSAEMEYGALFANVVDAALDSKAVDDCALGVQIQSDVVEKTIPRIIVLDPATVGNEYAVVMGHLSDSPKKDMVIVDYVKTFKGSHQHPVDIEEVENFVRSLCRNFKIVHIGIDQHQSADTVQKFQREGLPIKMVNITPKYNGDMYHALFCRINTKHIIFPNLPEIKDELRFLQKRFVGWGWVVVAARGHFDDIPDSIANLCLLLEQLLSKKAEWGSMIRAIGYEAEIEVEHVCPKCGHEWTTVEIHPIEIEPPESENRSEMGW